VLFRKIFGRRLRRPQSAASNKRRNRRQPAAAIACEPLEARAMLAVTAVLYEGVLTIRLDDSGDSATLENTGGSYEVVDTTDDGSRSVFTEDIADVASISVIGANGEQTFSVLDGGAIEAAFSVDSTVETTEIGEDIDADTDAIVLEGAVTLTSDVTLTATTVTFNAAVAGDADDVKSLDIDGSAVFASTVTASRLDVSGSANLGGNVDTTDGTQTYTGAVTLTDNVILTAGTVSFGAAVTGTAKSLEVSGSANLGGDVDTTGGTQTYGGAVTLTDNVILTAGTVSFGAAVTGTAKSLEVIGSAELGSNVTTTGGTQIYRDAVTLTSGVTLSADTVTFNAAVAGGADGVKTLDITGDAVFASTVTASHWRRHA